MTSPPLRDIRLPAPRPNRTLRAVVIAVALVLVLAPAVATRIADWLWYRDIGFERVFLTKIIAQWALGLAAGIGGFVILYVNGRIALRGVPRKNLHIRDASVWAQAGPQELAERVAAWVILPATLLIGLFLALASGGKWRELAQFFYRTPFGVADPIFGRDVGYYVFTIPMVESALTFANSMLWLSLLMAIALYIARTDIGAIVGERQSAWRFFVTPRAQMHLAVLGASLLAVTAVRVLFVDVPSLLLARRTVLFGATYTDLQVRLPLFRVMAFMLVIAGIALIWQARKGRLARGSVLVLGGVIAIAFLLGGVVPGLFQRLVVQPNELARETPPIQHHLTATRQASIPHACRVAVR